MHHVTRLLVLSAFGLGTAGADTYLSRWENATSCPFLVTGNGEAKIIPAKTTYDFGAFPSKDPQGIVVEPSLLGFLLNLQSAAEIIQNASLPLHFAKRRPADIPGDRTIMPWKRIKFDETGQNNDADPVLLQYVGGKFVTIFPQQAAVAEAVWPMG